MIWTGERFSGASKPCTATESALMEKAFGRLRWPGIPTRRLSGYLVKTDLVFEQCLPSTPQGSEDQAIASV